MIETQLLRLCLNTVNIYFCFIDFQVFSYNSLTAQNYILCIKQHLFLKKDNQIKTLKLHKCDFK